MRGLSALALLSGALLACPDPGGPADPRDVSEDIEDATPDVPPPVLVPEIHVNEIVASPLFGGEDWVELYNASDFSASLKGWSVRDSNDAHVHLLGSAATIAAGGFLVVEDLEGPGGDGFGFGASDEARVFDPDGELVDGLAWEVGEAGLGVSFGRSPDGGEESGSLVSPTKGAPNAELGTPELQGPVILNEIVASPLDGESDWIELFNPTEASVALSGWRVSDKASRPLEEWTLLPSESVLEPGEFLLLQGSLPDVEGAIPFGLGSADDVLLVTPEGELADAVSWEKGQAPTGASFGRLPDGTGGFVTLSPPTPGASNGELGGVQPGVVVISEFLSNPVATADADGEWIELTNTTDEAVDIGGWILADADGGQHVIAQGASWMLEAHAVAVFARTADVGANGGVDAVEGYGDVLALANAGDQIHLLASGVEVDRVEFDAELWGLVPGKAHALQPEQFDALANDDPANWCPAETSWAEGDAGSPGETNPGCTPSDPVPSP